LQGFYHKEKQKHAAERHKNVHKRHGLRPTIIQDRQIWEFLPQKSDRQIGKTDILYKKILCYSIQKGILFLLFGLYPRKAENSLKMAAQNNGQESLKAIRKRAPNQSKSPKKKYIVVGVYRRAVLPSL